jgi:rhodanese-related sulfurtransferase
MRLIDTEMTEETLAKVVPSKDTPVLFYCNGVKCGRAAKAVEKAVAWGYTKVHYYALGMEEWTRKRLPLIKRS